MAPAAGKLVKVWRGQLGNYIWYVAGGILALSVLRDTKYIGYSFATASASRRQRRFCLHSLLAGQKAHFAGAVECGKNCALLGRWPELE